jgi:polysaccharide deacetylase 2 family uncharacterized protein YibQ
MAKRARKTTRKPNRKARKPAKRRPAPANGCGLARLVWATAGALAVAVLALGAILFFGPDGREPRPSPPVATMQVPAQERPVATDPAPPTQTMPQPEPQVAAAPQPAPAWRQNAMPASAAPEQPMIAIVIDDMGLDRARSERTVDLPAPLTLAYLAYASDLAAQTRDARAAGHELLVHVPMQPGPGADPGPNAVLLGLDPAELDRRMAWNLSRFDNFVGINNHMGSQATADRPAMAKVMTMLRERGLLFLDSRTSGATVAQAEAEKHGIPALRRDVFLDHDPSPIAVRSALLDVEEVARRQGHAIAIGHPKDATIDALAEWLPDVRARGFALVPVSAVAARLAAASQ